MKRKKREISNRPKGVVDMAAEQQEQPENAPGIGEKKEAETVTVPGTAKFAGKGQVLVNGAVVAFKNGVFETKNENTIASLQKAGFERLA